MFTGIVETIGTIKEVRKVGENDDLDILIADASSILGDCHLGDSIAVNGTCLTVTQFTESEFKVGVSQETLRKTNVGELRVGDKVNLERAVSGDVRYGGHMVQGHVDTVASLVGREPDGDSIQFEFELRDKEFINYIVPKGFICVDGTSLTVIDVNYEKARFKIMMVSYTQAKVIMPLKKIGDKVNIEVDLTGKLIERQIQASLQNKDSAFGKMLEELVERKVREAMQK
ncbi:hypothetical protein KL930_003281 [Ogataea haglerorum]|uniref:Riboflavin synthase n=1 Tax=Ogataea haglerorum TaxID=1937702 RepID=A0AAN6D4F8_9ASCO|nr:uncharacterized protein KL911_002467 [Ogataea haglerorum]KAG7696254.1 hypothetical protein KL915_002618 [Ogataea haglerorum]KAG7696626.1 hypothetical protein KL951_003082 [Ogataea haglerorum]KAG7706930.1 hypothetical protein KL914_002814 [Ogataea haglerorum]KAG7708763.1 hypothetical protein KL950_002283 [Ogataea haglerorum]KAG7716258.1 hypothetical protein KL913_003469 [Ogataea haglerorum]